MRCAVVLFGMSLFFVACSDRSIEGATAADGGIPPDGSVPASCAPMSEGSADGPFASQWRVVNTIHHGETLSVTYDGTPRYRALALRAQEGADLRVEITAETGTPVGFFLDAAGAK